MKLTVALGLLFASSVVATNLNIDQRLAELSAEIEADADLEHYYKKKSHRKYYKHYVSHKKRHCNYKPPQP